MSHGHRPQYAGSGDVEMECKPPYDVLRATLGSHLIKCIVIMLLLCTMQEALASLEL